MLSGYCGRIHARPPFIWHGRKFHRAKALIVMPVTVCCCLTVRIFLPDVPSVGSRAVARRSISARGTRGLPIYPFIAFKKHNSVYGGRPRKRDLSIYHILSHRIRIPIQRVAPTSRTRHLHLEHISRTELCDELPWHFLHTGI